ncbi:unnamed protein product [Ectocarpus sp. 4 AP-2014]
MGSSVAILGVPRNNSALKECFRSRLSLKYEAAPPSSMYQGKYAEAEPLYERCQAIEEKVLGSEHPSLATTLNNRGGLLYQQGKYAEAEPLYERCQAIEEKVLGSEHPSLARTLNNRAGLLYKQGKHKEAVTFLERASCIFRKKLGESHHSTVDTRNSLERLRKLVREREVLSSCHET